MIIIGFHWIFCLQFEKIGSIKMTIGFNHIGE
jgi:hypothetical protein